MSDCIPVHGHQNNLLHPPSKTPLTTLSRSRLTRVLTLSTVATRHLSLHPTSQIQSMCCNQQQSTHGCHPRLQTGKPTKHHRFLVRCMPSVIMPSVIVSSVIVSRVIVSNMSIARNFTLLTSILTGLAITTRLAIGNLRVGTFMRTATRNPCRPRCRNQLRSRKPSNRNVLARNRLCATRVRQHKGRHQNQS